MYGGYCSIVRYVGERVCVCVFMCMHVCVCGFAQKVCVLLVCLGIGVRESEKI